MDFVQIWLAETYRLLAAMMFFSRKSVDAHGDTTYVCGNCDVLPLLCLLCYESNNHQSLRQIPRTAHQIIHGSAGEALISKEIKIAACNCKLNALHALNTKLT